MKKPSRPAKLRIATLLAATIAFVGLTTVAQPAQAAEQQAAPEAYVPLPPDLGQAIRAGFRPMSAYRVTSGTQTYICGADGTWPTASTPRANLVKIAGSGPKTIYHFGGPRWAAPDGSTIVGTVVNRVPVEGQLPWLLLT